MSTRPPQTRPPPTKAAGRLRTCWRQCVYPLAQFWEKSWTAEICSCLFAMVSLVGLIITLLAHQDKPLPKWPNLVNINSIVSLFALLMRASTGMVLAEGISQLKWQWFRNLRKLKDMELFDSASRSAWGSVVLLLNLGRRRPYFIAAFGAFTTIMASFCGFALQQLIVFQQCLQPDENAVVGISKTNAYFAQGIQTKPTTADVYHPMAAAVTVGMFQPVEDLTSVLSHGCHTGNCTFPAVNGSTFSTVAISHSCEDITAQVEMTSINELDRDIYNISIPLDSTRDNLTLQLDGVLNLVAGVVYYQDTEMISTVKILMQKRPSNLTNYLALSCSIWPSVNTYGVNITNSVISEKFIDSVPIGSNLLQVETGPTGGTSDEWDITYKLAMDHTLRNGSKTLCNRQKNGETGFIKVAESNINNAPKLEGIGDSRDNITSWYYPKDCVWAVGRGSSTGIYAYMKEIFDEQVLVWMPGIAGNHGSTHMRELYQEGNMTLKTVDNLFKNMTTAMTTVVRTQGSEGPTWSANGTVWYSTTCMTINWPWLSYPATMIGLSVFFLILVHIETRGVENSRLWKSSVLATIFCEVDDKIKQEATSVDREVIKEIAKSTSVSVSQEPGTLKLVTR